MGSIDDAEDQKRDADDEVDSGEDKSRNGIFVYMSWLLLW